MTTEATDRIMARIDQGYELTAEELYYLSYLPLKAVDSMQSETETTLAETEDSIKDESTAKTASTEAEEEKLKTTIEWALETGQMEQLMALLNVESLTKSGLDALAATLSDDLRRELDTIKADADQAELTTWELFQQQRQDIRAWEDEVMSGIEGLFAPAIEWFAERLEDLMMIPGQVIFNLFRNFFFEEE